MTVLLCVVLIILALILVTGYFLARFVNMPKSTSIEEQENWEREHDCWRNYDELKKEVYTVTSFDGYKLYAEFIPADEESDAYCILSHGYTSSRYGSFKYLHMYRAFGFNCIIYDDRAHGVNAKTTCTMGLKESKDLIAVIDDCHRRFGDDIILGLQGESMGTALTITALKYKPKVDFVVADCGYCDLQSLLKNQINKSFHLPKWMIYPASFMSKVCFGYFFSEVSPIKSLYDNEVPICFMHGGSDRLIPPHHSVNMYFANKAYSELHIFDLTNHAQSVLDYEDLYWDYVNEFLGLVLGADE